MQRGRDEIIKGHVDDTSGQMKVAESSASGRTESAKMKVILFLPAADVIFRYLFLNNLSSKSFFIYIVVTLVLLSSTSIDGSPLNHFDAEMSNFARTDSTEGHNSFHL